jgi:hypothetical protein
MATAVASSSSPATALNSRFSMDDQSSLASSFRWLPPRVGTRTAEPSLRSVKLTPFANAFKRTGRQRSVASNNLVDEGTGFQQCALSSASVPDLTLLNSKQKGAKKRSRLCEMENNVDPASSTKSKRLLNRLTAITRLKSQNAPPPPLPTADPSKLPRPALRPEAQEALKACGLTVRDQTEKPRIPDQQASSLPPQRPPRPDDVSAAGAIKRDWEERNRLPDITKLPPTPAELNKMKSFKFGGSKVDVSVVCEGPPGIVQDDAEPLLPPQPVLVQDDSGSIKSRRGMQGRLPPLDFSKSSPPPAGGVPQIMLAQTPSTPPRNTMAGNGSPPNYRTVKNDLVVPLSPGLLFDACAVPLPLSPDGAGANPGLEDLCLFPLPPTPILSSSSPPSSYSNSLPDSRSHSPELQHPTTPPGAIPSPYSMVPEAQSLSPTVTTPTLSICQTLSTASVFSRSPASATFDIRVNQDFDPSHIPIIRESPVEENPSPIAFPETEVILERTPPVLAPNRRDTEPALPLEEKAKKRRMSVAASFGTLRRSVIGSLSSKSTKNASRKLSPGLARSPIDVSQLPPSPSLPAEFCRSPTSPGFTGAQLSPLSPTFHGSERGRAVTRSNSRMAVDPKIHSNTALLVELEAMKSSTNDEETQRLSEMAYLT